MARLCPAQICLTLAFCVLTGGMCSLDLTEGVQDSNHFGSCVCQLSCGDQGENNSAIVELISLLASTRTSHNDLFQRVISQLQQQREQHLALTNEIKSLLESKTNSLETKLVAQRRLLESVDEKAEGFSQQFNQLQQTVQQLTPKSEYKPAYRVFRVLSPQGLYRLSQIEARAMCLSKGAKLATVAQLEAAWKHGMDMCACGWLDDGSSRYPIQWPRNGCGGGQAGLRVCEPAGYSGSNLRDAYCYA